MACNLIVEKLYPDEPEERLFRRYMKKLKKENIIREFLEHEFYSKPSEVRHRKEVRKKRQGKAKPKKRMRNRGSGGG